MIGQVVTTISNWISTGIEQFGYTGIFVITFLENVIAPIPSEFVFPWAGFLAYQGELNIWLISLSGALGSVAAALILFYLGHKFSGDDPERFVNKYGKYLLISVEDLEKAQKWFDKYGIWTVLFFRIIPLARTLISIPAGFTKMNVIAFTTFTFIGTFIWCLILTYAGYALGQNWDRVQNILSTYENIIYIVLAILLGWYLYTKRDNIKDLFKGTKEKIEN